MIYMEKTEKQILEEKIPELTEYLEKETGFKIRMEAMDRGGVKYEVSVSTDDNYYKKWQMYHTDKYTLLTSIRRCILGIAPKNEYFFGYFARVVESIVKLEHLCDYGYRVHDNFLMLDDIRICDLNNLTGVNIDADGGGSVGVLTLFAESEKDWVQIEFDEKSEDHWVHRGRENCSCF